MSIKHVIALGTYHQAQYNGHALNDKFARVISLIREKHAVQIILEEWFAAEQSFASTLAPPHLEWRNVGTPAESCFKTNASGLNCDQATYDPRKPMLQEYGPLDVQELRESYMVGQVETYMKHYRVGLFILGLAHLHSILSKLKTVGFDVVGYSWIEQI